MSKTRANSIIAVTIFAANAIAGSRPVQIQLLPEGSNFLAFTVGATDGQGPPPTGTLTATVDGTGSGPVAVSHGAADPANSSSAFVGFPSPFSGGDHSVAVQYSGDNNYAGGSATFVKSLPKYTVTIGPPILTATGFSVPIYNNQYAPSGSVTVQIDSSGPMTAALKLGTGSPGPGPSTADFSWPPSLSGGSHTIAIQYSGDHAFLPASQTYPIQVPTSRTVQLTFVSSANSIAVTATPADGNGPKPTGTISAQLDGASLGATALGGGTGFSSSAVFTVPKVSPGSHAITVQYSGDANYAAGSGTYSFSVNKPTLSTSLGAITGTYGSPVLVYIQLNDPSGAAQGTVSLLDAGKSIAAANVLNSVATLTVNGLAVGTHSLIARFSGNTAVDDLALSVIISQASTQTRLTGTPVPQTSVMISVQASVSFAASAGTGTVIFQENGLTLSTQAIPASGTVTFSTTGLKTGTHTLTASYSGDSNYLGSTSTPLTFQAGPIPTTSNIVSVSPNSPVQPGSAVDISVVVSSAVGTPVGQVSLTDAGTSLATLTLSPSATATFHVTLASPGSHNLTAVFLGSPGFAASSSTVQTVMVVQPAFTTVSSASGTAALTPGSLASAFGAGLSAATAQATLPLTTDLGGVKITVTDAAGKSLSALLVFVSPSQVNFLIPLDAAVGLAQLKLVSATGTFLSSVVLTAQAPALFSADSSGSGVAAAFLILAHSDGTQDVVPVFQCNAGACKTVPLSLGTPSDVAVLSFYGSGFDGATNVRVRIGVTELVPDYAGAQGQYPGLDQVNVRLPSSLAGLGVQQLSIVTGSISNVLVVEFR